MIDVFKVGVSLTMMSNASQILGVLLKDLLGVEKGAKAAESSLTRVKAAAAGAGLALGGIAALAGLWGVVDAGKELNHQLELMRNRGGEFAAQLNAIKQTARDVSISVPTSAESSNVKMIGEIGGQIGVANADKLAPLGAKFQAITSGGEEDLQSMLKIIEQRGRLWQRDAKGNDILGSDGKPIIDMEAVRKEFDSAYKAIQGEGGQLTVPMLLQMAKQGSITAAQQDADTFYAREGEIAVNMGASRAGTAMSSFAAQFQGGTMTKKTAEEMERLGYLKSGEWHSDAGHITIEPKALDRLRGDVVDPFAFGADLIARMRDGLHLNPDQMVSELTRIFGRVTVQRLFGDIIKNGPSFQRASDNAAAAQGIDASYANLQKNDIATNIKALNAALQSFGEEISILAAPTAIRLLQGLTAAIHDLNVMVQQHPDLSYDILMVVSGLAGLATILGLAALASALAAMVAPFTALAALAAAGGTLLLLPKAIHDVIAAFNDWLGILKGPQTGGAARYGGSHLNDNGNNSHTQEDEQQHPHGRVQRAPASWRGGGLSPTSISYVPPFGEGASINLTSCVYLDGKKIAQVVSEHQADALAMPSQSRSGFDPRMNAYAPGQMVRL